MAGRRPEYGTRHEAIIFYLSHMIQDQLKTIKKRLVEKLYLIRIGFDQSKTLSLEFTIEQGI